MVRPLIYDACMLLTKLQQSNSGNFIWTVMGEPRLLVSPSPCLSRNLKFSKLEPWARDIASWRSREATSRQIACQILACRCRARNQSPKWNSRTQSPPIHPDLRVRASEVAQYFIGHRWAEVGTGLEPMLCLYKQPVSASGWGWGLGIGAGAGDWRRGGSVGLSPFVVELGCKAVRVLASLCCEATLQGCGLEGLCPCSPQ